MNYQIVFDEDEYINEYEAMGELMNRIVKTIIDEWDPIDLFPLAPNDEYQNEIKEIVDFIYKNENTSPLALAKEINRVFTTRFGADVYEKDVNECLLVAQKILLTISAT